MKTILNWLYENWMKGTPFLALYTFILIWLYVGHDTIEGIALTLIWLQCPFYWAHEFEEYVLPGGFLDFFNRNMMGSTRGDKPLTKVGSFWINIPLGIYTIWFFISNGLVSTGVNIVSVILGIIAQASMMVYGFAYLVPTSKKEGYHRSVQDK